MSFLPEEDQEFLDGNGIKYKLLTEQLPGGDRRGVVFVDLALAGNLRHLKEGAWVACVSCDVLVVIPAGYATTKLDSFYTQPRLKRPDGNDPQATNPENQLFSQTWQFWSRHLEDNDWRVGMDGLR